MKQIHQLLALFLVALALWSCKEEKEPNKPPKQTVQQPQLPRPAFNADSAYFFVKKQVDFGPRVPGTKTHKATSEWLKAKLGSYTDEVMIQTAEATMYNDKKIPVYNIIGSFNPEAPQRILLAAHWDSRHLADKDFDESKKDQPIDGANDGASGVGVLLEIARQLQAQDTDLGVDIIFFDAEDLGTPEGMPSRTDTWCLGSQHWAQNPHVEDYKARYGILLDMVGAPDAVFKYESQAYRYPNISAAPLYGKAWNIARKLGYGDKFINAEGGGITDDHIYVMRYRNFPMIDIIDYEPHRQGGFGHYHHTHQDNMDVISKSTLQAVGETVLGVLKY